MLRKKIFITLISLIIIRMGNFIPIPNIDQPYVISILKNNNSFFRMIFNGENTVLSILTLGITPYINASIFIQFLTNVIPFLEKLQKEEGKRGREKIKQYTRFLTLIFAIFESLSLTFSLKPILFNWNNLVCLQINLCLITGSLLVFWLSDLITENGIGDGSSLVITLNILSTLPKTILALFKHSNSFGIILSFLSLTCLIGGIVYLEEAEDNIPLISAKQLIMQEKSEQKSFVKHSYLPLKITQGGIIPIIFASSFVTFFTIVINFICNFYSIEFNIDNRILNIIYKILNFILVLGFTLLYSNIILNPKKIANELNQKMVIISNAQIKPGKQTAVYLKNKINRLSLLGGLFLAILSTVPNIQNVYGFNITSLLILVGITLETNRQIKALLLSKIY